MKSFKELMYDVQVNESKAREMSKDVAGSYASAARLHPNNKSGFNSKMTGPSDVEHSEKRKLLGIRTKRNWKREEPNGKESLSESLSHDYLLQSLADKDINAHIKDGKVVVHPDDAAEARKHLKKIGHDHLRVTTKDVHQVAEEVEELDESIENMSDAKVKYYATKKFPRGRYSSKEIKAEHDRRMRTVPNYRAVQPSLNEEVELDEILDPSMGAGEYVKDFQKSAAPQFKGKSQEKRRIMGIAAYMAAKKNK
jgi:hypothetical protein